MKLFGIKNVLIACGLSFIALTSCSDMLETESDQYIFADGENLTDPTDTIYSMVGILNKLQAVADRTVILGEVRGDLVQLTPFASTELQEVSIWEVGTDISIIVHVTIMLLSIIATISWHMQTLR